MKGLTDRKKILFDRVKSTETNINELKSNIKLSVDNQIEIFTRISTVQETYKNLYTRMIKVTMLSLQNVEIDEVDCILDIGFAIEMTPMIKWMGPATLMEPLFTAIDPTLD
ncbi:hypothetical protein MXB_80, partial [Myxobolus squamalis]